MSITAQFRNRQICITYLNLLNAKTQLSVKSLRLNKNYVDFSIGL